MDSKRRYGVYRIWIRYTEPRDGEIGDSFEVVARGAEEAAGGLGTFLRQRHDLENREDYQIEEIEYVTKVDVIRVCASDWRGSGMETAFTRGRQRL